MSAVLRHVVKYRPNWHIDFQAELGRHCIGRGIVANTFEFGSPYPSQYYDAEVEILLFDTWYKWGDRPNTRVSSCLHERFGLEWVAECRLYQVHIREESKCAAQTILHPKSNIGVGRTSRRFVAIHYEGDSSQLKKNLSHRQIDEICTTIEDLDCVPVILDWRCRSPLSYRKLRSPGGWGGDAEMVCAVISQCAAFVGIDSGPAKCASATDTQTLVVWTGHHPALFHDPADNTTHLVPNGYHRLEPVCGNQAVIEFFEKWYNIRMYEHDPIKEIKAWLEEVLKRGTNQYTT